MPRDIALDIRLPKIGIGAASPPNRLDSNTRSGYGGAFVGSNITWEQLPTGQWIVSCPQDAGDDYIDLGGNGDIWYAKAMWCWYNPVAEMSQPPAQYNVILGKNTSVVYGFFRRDDVSPNTVYFNLEDNTGANSSVSYSITDHSAWLFLFGFFTSARRVRFIVNGAGVGTGGGILADNHGQGTNMTGSPIRLGGGLATRYDICKLGHCGIAIGDENTNTDSYWEELARSLYEVERGDFGV